MMPINLTEIETSLSPGRILSLPRQAVSALYIHVPYCRQKCGYCDFYSVPGVSDRGMEDYVAAALQEARWWSEYAAESGTSFETVFMGGGTPTALPRPLMQRLLVGLKTALPIHADAEWTTEANPATLDGDYCDMLLECGVNRLSLGAQSMIDSELRALGRIHGAGQVRQTVSDAMKAGFRRISVDLMYAIPGQTPESWQYSLEAVLAMGVRHISCYCLTLEEHTPMWHQARQGEISVADEQQQLQFMRFTREFLREREVAPYELSNYALPGEVCRHNLVYWSAGNYLGLGPAAASHLSGCRWRNAPDIRGYTRSVLQDGSVPTLDAETLTPTQRAVELVMLMLRCEQGLTWDRLGEVAGETPWRHILEAAITRLGSFGLLLASSQGVKLTEQGVLVADGVISELVRELQ